MTRRAKTWTVGVAIGIGFWTPVIALILGAWRG